MAFDMTVEQQSGNLLGLNLEELENLAVSFGQPRYRGRQLYHGIYARRVRDFAGLTDLNHDFRDAIAAAPGNRLSARRAPFLLPATAPSATFSALHDGNLVETVYMPEEDRTTLCLSSQVGCALDCRFCFTALLGSNAI